MQKLFLIIAVLVLAHPAFSQVSMPRIQKARDYVITTLTNEYLANVSAKYGKTEYYKKLKPFLESNRIDSPIKVDTLSRLLSENSFENTNDYFVARVKDIQADTSLSPNNVAEHLVSGIYEALIALERNDLNGNKIIRRLLIRKDSLEREVSNYFRTPASAPVVADTLKKNVAVNPLKKDTLPPAPAAGIITKNPAGIFFDFPPGVLSLVCLGLCLILLVLYLVLNVRITGYKNQVTYVHNEIQDMKNDSVSNDLLNRLNTLEASNAVIRRQMDELRDAIVTIAGMKAKQTAEPLPLLQFTDPGAFYMGLPIEDFFLNHSKSAEYKKGAALFRFIPDNAYEAKFEFISDEETIRFLQANSPNIIKPACKFEHPPLGIIKSVLTLAPGLVRLEDGNWKIVEKARVRFE